MSRKYISKVTGALISGAILLGGWWLFPTPEWNNYQPLLGPGYTNYELGMGANYGYGMGYNAYGMGYSPYGIGSNPYVSQYLQGPIGGYYQGYPYSNGYNNYGYSGSNYGYSGWY